MPFVTSSNRSSGEQCTSNNIPNNGHSSSINHLAEPPQVVLSSMRLLGCDDNSTAGLKTTGNEEQLSNRNSAATAKQQHDPNNNGYKSDRLNSLNRSSGDRAYAGRRDTDELVGAVIDADTTSQTNVIWVQNPWKQVTANSSGSGTDATMPAATLGSGGGVAGGGGGGAGAAGAGGASNNEECGIRDVWAHNLEDEFRTIRQIVQKYPYVAMDTEFPGVVARPIGEFRSTADYQYQLLRCNVDLLRIIQLGLTFMDENGKTPGGSYTTWQFNFKFNLNEDMYAQDSIELLQNSGIKFKKHEEEGIEPLEFAELLMTSGIVLMENIKWLSFHSGYDFGYLIKLLTDSNLPTDESEFFELLKLYFPTIYDVKYLMKSCKTLKGGLQEVAEQLDLERIGPQHQAGSDSLLTGMAFFKMKEMFFEDTIDDSKFSGHLYGLGTSFAINGCANNYANDNGDNSNSS